MPQAIANGRITNAKGDFRRGDVIEGKKVDLQPLVDSGAARWVLNRPDWPLKTPPRDYLERHPDGPNADLAREILDGQEE